MDDKDDDACVSVAKRWFEVNLMESSEEARLERWIVID